MRFSSRLKLTTTVAAAAGLFLTGVAASAATLPSLTRVSSDSYTGADSQHQTEVEPGTFSYGATEVAAFQTGRIYDGGSTNIGWATTTNNGATWTHGFLPKTTIVTGGPFTRATDPSVAYDAKYKRWLISSLGMDGTTGAAVIVSQSSSGLVWGSPKIVTEPGGSASLDKPWIACDNNSRSPHYGNCYEEWDDNGNLDLVWFATSKDGGNTWVKKENSADQFHGLGGQPVTLPNGDVVVPVDDLEYATVDAVLSPDGGSRWGPAEAISAIDEHANSGGLRQSPLPTARADSAGNIYLLWHDCRFEVNCDANDIVLSKSSNGVAWTPPLPLSTDGTGTPVDHFLPGLGIDPTTSGKSAHLGVFYYTYPTANCSPSTCKLEAAYVSSTNGGSSWSAPRLLTGAMSLSWLPNTTQGPMVGDYFSTSFLNHKAFPVFPVAHAPSGGTFNVAMYTPTSGL